MEFHDDNTFDDSHRALGKMIRKFGKFSSFLFYALSLSVIEITNFPIEPVIRCATTKNWK